MTVHPGLRWTADTIAAAMKHGMSDGLEIIHHWKDRLMDTWNDPVYAGFWSDLEVYEQKALTENLPELSFPYFVNSGIRVSVKRMSRRILKGAVGLFRWGCWWRYRRLPLVCICWRI